MEGHNRKIDGDLRLQDNILRSSSLF